MKREKFSKFFGTLGICCLIVLTPLAGQGADLVIGSNISTTGSWTLDGNIAATSFTGNGSGLTNVSAAGLSCTGCVTQSQLDFAPATLGGSNIWTGTQTFNTDIIFPDGVWSNAGKVGIGTVNPGAKLEISKKVDSNDDSQSANGLRVSTGGTLKSGSESQLIGISDHTNIDTANTNDIWGPIGMDVETYNNGSGNLQRMIGIGAIAASLGQGNVDDVEGITVQVGANGYNLSTPGTVNNAYGIYMTNYAAFNAKIENLHGIYIDNALPVMGGNITNNYALYIKNQTGASTQNYSVYSEGGANYFGGNVGIGVTQPSYSLHVNGDIAYTGNILDLSDIRVKENIHLIQNAMDKISSINGIYFNYKGKSPDKREVGVIAQEVERVLPEIVSENAEGYKSVDYSKFAPLLVEAVKAQQSQINELRAANEMLRYRIEVLENGK